MSALDFIIRQTRQTKIFPNCPSEQAHIHIISVKMLTVNEVRIPISIMGEKKKNQELSERKLPQRKGVRAQFL